MNRLAFFCFLILFLSPSLLKMPPARPHGFIVWNVGQGLWTTWAGHSDCFHFDMGGEFSPARRVRQLCAGQMNRIYLSHWDWDHISFVGKIRTLLPNVCLALPPDLRSSPRKEKLLQGLLPCPPLPANSKGPVLVNPLSPLQSGRSSNELSHVMKMETALIPGDSVATQEKTWSVDPRLRTVKWLVLGHHGSRTSTSDFLLRHLPNLKQAIASARKSRYGHPHAEVIERLARSRIPLLKTEDWGNIWILL